MKIGHTLLGLDLTESEFVLKSLFLILATPWQAQRSHAVETGLPQNFIFCRVIVLALKGGGSVTLSSTM